jgi:hypothetical protein
MKQVEGRRRVFQRGLIASATKKMTEPPIAAIQKKSMSKGKFKV